MQKCFSRVWTPCSLDGREAPSKRCIGVYSKNVEDSERNVAFIPKAGRKDYSIYAWIILKAEKTIFDKEITSALFFGVEGAFDKATSAMPQRW